MAKRAIAVAAILVAASILSGTALAEGPLSKIVFFVD
jgi:hypothetical protein